VRKHLCINTAKTLNTLITIINEMNTKDPDNDTTYAKAKEAIGKGACVMSVYSPKAARWQFPGFE
jgi:hypothetical protein